MLILRTLGTWLLVTIAMIVNGAFRVTILQPWLGERVADVVSAGLGIGRILLLTRPFLRRLQVPTHRQFLAISGAWLALTVAFEFLFGHYVMGESWAALLANYNILRVPTLASHPGVARASTLLLGEAVRRPAVTAVSL